MEKQTNDDFSDEELQLENVNEELDKEKIIQRLKTYTFSFTENVENSLTFCLKLLEERTVPKKNNSTPASIASVLFAQIPYVGKGVSSIMTQGEVLILNKIDKKNSRTLADLVYYFSDNKQDIRKVLIEASLDLFYSFEDQFKRLTCNGGPNRAMQKLAKDAANRMFTYFLDQEQNSELSKDGITRAVIMGDSVRNKMLKKSGRSVKNNEDEEWKSADIYTKVGLFNEESKELLTKNGVESDIYGYRRLLEWEDLNKIVEEWEICDVEKKPVYALSKNDFEMLYPILREYVMSKVSEEEAMLDREKKHEESLEDRKLKHEEILITFNEKFGDVLDLLVTNYKELLNQQEKNDAILAILSKNKNIHLEKHDETKIKLEEIHKDLEETRMKQEKLQVTTTKIEKKIEVIEEKNMSGPVVKIDADDIKTIVSEKAKDLEKLVRDNHEVKKVVENVKKIEPEVRHKLKDLFKKW